MAERIPLEKLAGRMPSRIDLFICAASFEERCRSIATQLASAISAAIIVRNKESMSSSETELRKLHTLIGEGKCTDTLLSLESPVETADTLANQVVSKITHLDNGNVFIDITTFTHEQLLILLALIQTQPVRAKITLGYTGAGDYSVNTE